jgi:hypothetical protein
MSNIESINLSIKIDGKAIGVAYEGWIKIHKFIQQCNNNRQKLLDVAKNIQLECYYYHVFSQ